jgi:hypothetical protein
VELRQQQRSAPVRPAHPVMRELVAGVDLSTAALSKRTDAAQHSTFAQMLSNAEYWLSFDLAAFEPLLMKSPSPLRELGVAIALRFSEGIDGGLTLGDLGRARELLDPNLADDLKRGVTAGLEALERVVKARESIPALEEAGFKRYAATPSLSVHALRAMGKSNIAIAGHADDEKRVEVRIGEQIQLTATDERGRPLQAPEIESHLEAPLYARDESEPNKRTIFLLVPGEYFVRVPGRATGDRKLVAI